MELGVTGHGFFSEDASRWEGSGLQQLLHYSLSRQKTRFRWPEILRAQDLTIILPNITKATGQVACSSQFRSAPQLRVKLPII